MKKYFLAILSIFCFFTISAQEPEENAMFLKENSSKAYGENVLFLKQNSPKLYSEIKSFAENKYGDNKTMVVHEISEHSKSVTYFIKNSETIDSEIFYSAINKRTENGLTNWPKVEYEYKKQVKRYLDSDGVESNVSNPYLNLNTKKKTHRTEFGLLGDVKTIKETSYIEVEKFGGIIKEKSRRDKYYNKDFYSIFNKRGYRIKEYKYESDGSLYSEFTYKYKKKGTIKLGKGTTSLMSFLAPNEYYYFFEYDDNGNIILESHYQSSDLNLMYKYAYEYDTINNQIGMNHYRSYGDFESKVKYKYNDKGNKIEVNQFKSDGNLEYKTKYEYDDKGNLIKWNRYKPDGSIVNQGSFKYDSYGNVIEGEGYTYKYEYDEEGNWIVKTEFKDNVSGHIIEREIEYF